MERDWEVAVVVGGKQEGHLVLRGRSSSIGRSSFPLL